MANIKCPALLECCCPGRNTFFK